MRKAIILTFLATALTFAQTTPQAANYFVGLGAGYNAAGYNGTSAQRAGVLASLGIQPNGSNFYSITTLIMQPGNPSGVGTIRTGIGYLLKQSGDFSLIGLADGGASATGTAILGNVGGGVLVRYDLGGVVSKFKNQGVGLVTGVRLAAISGTAVQPEYIFSITKKF